MPSTPPALIETSTRHAVYLEGLKTHDAMVFRKYLNDMRKGIVAELAGENITDWNKARLNKKLTAIRGVLNTGFSEFETEWRRQILELAEYEAGFEARALNKIVRYDFDLPSSDQIRQAVFGSPLQVTGPDGGALLDSFYADWSNREKRRVSNLVRMGYAQGQTTPQIIRNIQGSAPALYTDGALAVTDRAMATLVRTSLQHAATQAREATWDRNKDVIRGVRIVATLDGRTTPQCQSLDGRVFPVGSGPRPPFHPGCRTTTAAALDDRYKFLEEGGTRAARDTEDGRKIVSVPANQTYYGWLKNQPQDFQDSVIGPTRGKLLRDGGLSAQRFQELQLSRQFQPHTLAEIKRLEPLAFSRAGLE